MVAAGGPLRAEGFPKRRCRFEFIAAKPHLSPKKAMHDSLGFHAWPLYLAVPVRYPMWTKGRTKIELAGNLIEEVIPLLKDRQVLL